MSNERVIKFRAWDEINKELIYPILHSLNKMSNGDILNRYENVMQFTGLFDLHGRELYEGDIIRANLFDGSCYVWKICFNQDTCAFEAFDSSDRRSYLSDAWMAEFGKEIIGNIYQNPELMELQYHFLTR